MSRLTHVDEAKLEDLGAYVAATLGDAVEARSMAVQELTLTARRERVLEVLRFLRDDPRCQFQTLVDICGVDYPDRPLRFEVVYHLLSMRRNQRVRVKLATDDAAPVPSATAIWPAANWFEREAFDMYGILFDAHPDFRRILTDYGFQGFPLRKEFPMSGEVEVRYDEAQKRVVYEPVKLNQAFRSFDFLSPWEGMGAPLPGDEKAKTHG